jgi:hypothetical protein
MFFPIYIMFKFGDPQWYVGRIASLSLYFQIYVLQYLLVIPRLPPCTPLSLPCGSSAHSDRYNDYVQPVCPFDTSPRRQLCPI